MTKEPLLTLILGKRNQRRGCGKTTLAAALAATKMVGAGAHSDLRKCDAEIEKLKAGGWPVYRSGHVHHLVYATDKITACGMGYNTEYSMDFDFAKLGLYTKEGREVMHFYPHSTLVIFEIQRKLDSRKSMTKDGPDEELLAFLELQRHFGIKVIAEGHSWDRIEKRFREFSDCIIEVQGQTHEYHPKDIKQKYPVKTTWELLTYDGPGTYEKYITTNDAALAKKEKYTINYNIFNVVDSFSGKAYFMNGLQNGKNFDDKISKPTGHDKDEMTKYCDIFPFKKDKGE